jgi:hypothetical protein
MIRIVMELDFVTFNVAQPSRLAEKNQVRNLGYKDEKSVGLRNETQLLGVK